jgi:LEA14-like dessication related protein
VSAAALVLAVVVRLAEPAPASPLGISLALEGTASLRVTLSGPEADLAPGSFRGTISVNGSAAEVPVSGMVAHANGRWQLPFSVKFADVPEDWADRFRSDGFTYRLRSSGPPSREWTGTRAWKDVELEGSREAMSDFAALDDVALTDVSLLSSEARARVSVRNPFAFPLKIASTDYVLFADGHEVGSGQTQGMILHPAQKNVLTMPIDVDHGALLSAAGGAVLSGGEVAVQLKGKLVVRLKTGDVAVPLALSGHLGGGS